MRKTIIRNRSNVNRVEEAGFSAYVAALHRAVHAIGLYFDAEFEGRITQPEAVVLLHLAGSGGSTINDVHRAFLHKRSTLTSVVDRLEQKALVRREISDTDRRNFMLKLTGDGRKAAERVVQSVTKLERAIGANPARLRAVIEVLEKTIDAASVRES